MSSSLRRLLANRANAKKSAGPVTAEGKAKVSQNRTVHGLTGNFHVLEGEDQAKYDALIDQLMQDERPVGIAEIELVKKMAEHTWLRERASRFQEACFIVMPRTAEQRANVEAEMAVRPELERYIRYQAHHDRAYARASAELLKRKKERRLAAVGFESQKRAEAHERRRGADEHRKLERHKTALANDQKRFELAELKLFNQTAATAKRLNAFQTPREKKIAA